MEARSPALTHKVSELQKQLAGDDIAADLVTLEPGDIEELPTLPTGTSYRMRLL